MFIAASEIKAILTDKRVHRGPNDQMIFDYAISGTMDHTEQTFFEGIKNLEPGHYAVVEDDRIKVERWCKLAPRPSRSNYDGSVREARKLFDDSVRLRLRSDVPVGACLSGGMDSSSMVSAMRRAAGDKAVLQSYSAVFPGHDIDETKNIEVMTEAAKLGAHRVEPRPKDVVEDLRTLIYHQDEPIRSSSQLAQWTVMRLAHSQGMKVLLNGQGGDEVFAGYPYFFGNYYISLLRRFKFLTLLKEMRAYRRNHPKGDAVRYMLFHLLPRRLQRRLLIGTMPLDKEFRKRVKSMSPQAERIYFSRNLQSAQFDHINMKMRELLRYEDKSAMAFSIETRLPFLDHRLVDHAMSLPEGYRMSKGTTKRVFRDAMRGTVPDEILDDHRKIGFETPESEWFNDREVGKFITDILSSKEFKKRGYFDPKRLGRLWTNYTGDDKFVTRAIWRAVCIELWFRVFIDPLRNA